MPKPEPISLSCRYDPDSGDYVEARLMTPMNWEQPAGALEMEAQDGIVILNASQLRVLAAWCEEAAEYLDNG
mgnify:CR=1 FL=1